MPLLQELKNLVKREEKSGNLGNAARLQHDACIVAMVVYGEQSSRFIENKRKLASLYQRLGQDHSAQPVLEELLRVVSAAYGPNHKASPAFSPPFDFHFCNL